MSSHCTAPYKELFGEYCYKHHVLTTAGVTVTANPRLSARTKYCHMKRATGKWQMRGGRYCGIAMQVAVGSANAPF